MKNLRSVTLSLFLASSVMSGPAIADMTEYSLGYRMGLLSKYSGKGFIVKTGEGELLLGNDSGIVSAPIANPWSFSSSMDIYKQYENLVGQYVYIEYSQPLVALNPLYDTDYRIKSIKLLEKNDPQSCKADVSGWKSTGSRVARIVKASEKGNLIKTFEVTLQVGGSGNQFLNMSVTDETLYQCLLNWLKNGKRAQVEYVERFLSTVVQGDTNYNIVSIKPVKTLD